MGVLAEDVAIVAHGIEGDEAFDEEVSEFDEETVLGGVEDEGMEFFADAVLHEADFFPFHEFAFGFGGAALGLAGFRGDLCEFGFGDGGVNF